MPEARADAALLTELETTALAAYARIVQPQLKPAFGPAPTFPHVMAALLHCAGEALQTSCRLAGVTINSKASVKKRASNVQPLLEDIPSQIRPHADDVAVGTPHNRVALNDGSARSSMRELPR